MRLFLVKRIKPTGWDETNGVVVRANSPSEARELAASSRGDEGEDTWRNPELTTCNVLSKEGEPGVIIIDFHAG